MQTKSQRASAWETADIKWHCINRNYASPFGDEPQSSLLPVCKDTCSKAVFQVGIAYGGAGVWLPDEIKLRGGSSSYHIFISIIVRWASIRPSQSNCCNGLRPTQLPVVILALLQLEVFKSNWFYHERFLLHLPHSLSLEVWRASEQRFPLIYQAVNLT